MPFQMVVHPDTSTADNSAHKGNFGGILLESEIFKVLQQSLEKSTVQDTVVISGWSDNTPTAKKEYDFLIVSLALKVIVHIEVKRTLNKASKEKAIKQLDDGHSVISSIVPFPEARKWQYIQHICFNYGADEEVMASLDFRGWLKDLVSQILKYQETDGSNTFEEDTETYINILEYLLHQMFIQEDVLTQGKYLLPSHCL